MGFQNNYFLLFWSIHFRPRFSNLISHEYMRAVVDKCIGIFICKAPKCILSSLRRTVLIGHLENHSTDGYMEGKLRRRALVQGCKIHAMKPVHLGNQCRQWRLKPRVVYCHCFAWKLDVATIATSSWIHSFCLSHYCLLESPRVLDSIEKYLSLSDAWRPLAELWCLKMRKLTFFLN